MAADSRAAWLSVKVWGDFACFTRPEMKVERVSYPVMTPAAARGVLEAIFWKPEFSWQVREIWVLRPIRYVSLRRNEITQRQSERAAKAWAGSGGGYYADEDRAQRHTLALRDVAYTIWADVVLRRHATEPAAKYRDQFRRRLDRGQCFQQPYLGCREFAASFGPMDDERPVGLSINLGLILFDQYFEEDRDGAVLYRQHDARGARWVRGAVTPRFFAAQLEEGILRIPPELYQGGLSGAAK